MSEIKIITPPDKVYDHAYNIMLIYPDEQIKKDLQQILKDTPVEVNVYYYDLLTEDHAPDWLLAVFSLADTVVLNIDECDTEIRDLVSYFISYPKTFWLTKGENIYYNKISVNRVYTLDFLQSRLNEMEN